jgi:hypothetical protein
MMVRATCLGLTLSSLLLSGQSGYAQDSAPGDRLPEGAHVVVPAAPEDFVAQGQPKFYQEFLVTSPGVRPSYVPGYIPKVSPRFLNPRERPARGTNAWALSNRPEFQDLDGGHFGSTTGYQATGVTRDSPVGDYHLGRQEITRVLQFGYPEGQRVIEPVIVPMPSRSEKAGWYIDAGKRTQIDMGLSDSGSGYSGFPEKSGQRHSSGSGLARNSSQISNPNGDCAPSGQADGQTSNWSWKRQNPTGVQHLVRRD